MMFAERIAIIGVGLIGGSLAQALKAAESVDTIVGFGPDRSQLEAALRLGVIDEYHNAINDAIRGVDVVVLAAPLATFDDLLKAISAAWRQASPKENVIITDVGSAKRGVITAAREHLGDLFPRFVPGHPIAGTEKSGVEASFSTLFKAHRVILTPVAETAPEVLRRVAQMWEAVGAEIVYLEAEHHDRVLAATSHLPHLLAYALVDCLANMQDREEIFTFAAGGFADFTRIASSHPRLWHDICFANRDQLLKAIDQFERHLSRIRDAINNGDGSSVLNVLERAKMARDTFAE